MLKILKALPLAAPLLLGACATSPVSVPAPVGPSVLVLPGVDKSFEQFVSDDGVCGQFAAGRSGGGARTLTAAAGDPASSAGGAGKETEARSMTPQEHYDIGYLQCMYAKGHRVPVDNQSVYESQLDNYPLPPPPPPAHTMPSPPHPRAPAH